MRSSRVRPVTIGVVGLLIITAATAAAAAPGDPFRLGLANSINATSTLTGAVASRLVGLTNTSTTAGARALNLISKSGSSTLYVQNQGTGPGIQVSVGAGRPPITVSAGSGKAVNLDADKLDGLDSTNLNATTLDGIDSSGLIKGYGHLFSAGIFTGPGGTSGEIGPPTEWWGIKHACPANPGVELGTLTFTTYPQGYTYTRLWSDNGSADPVFVELTGSGATHVQATSPVEMITYHASWLSLPTIHQAEILVYLKGDAAGCLMEIQVVDT